MTTTPLPGGGFSGAAPGAAQARPTYARGAIGCIKASAPRGAQVIDLAAGTGLLAGQLVRAGLRVTATESSPELAHHIRRVLPGAPVVLAGVDLPFPSGVADVVTFAWSDGASRSAAGERLDLDGVFDEVAMVLRPGGVVALVHDEHGPSAPEPIAPGPTATAAIAAIAATGRFGAVRSESFAEPGPAAATARRTVVHLASVAS